MVGITMLCDGCWYIRGGGLITKCLRDLLTVPIETGTASVAVTMTTSAYKENFLPPYGLVSTSLTSTLTCRVYKVLIFPSQPPNQPPNPSSPSSTRVVPPDGCSLDPLLACDVPLNET